MTTLAVLYYAFLFLVASFVAVTLFPFLVYRLVKFATFAYLDAKKQWSNDGRKKESL